VSGGRIEVRDLGQDVVRRQSLRHQSGVINNVHQTVECAVGHGRGEKAVGAKCELRGDAAKVYRDDMGQVVAQYLYRTARQEKDWSGDFQDLDEIGCQQREENAVVVSASTICQPINVAVGVLHKSDTWISARSARQRIGEVEKLAECASGVDSKYGADAVGAPTVIHAIEIPIRCRQQAGIGELAVGYAVHIERVQHGDLAARVHLENLAVLVGTSI
jgi:hypothetical protein